MQEMKQIPLQKKFNPGAHKYDIILPPGARKIERKEGIGVKWKWILLIVLFVLVVIGAVYLKSVF